MQVNKNIQQSCKQVTRTKYQQTQQKLQNQQKKSVLCAGALGRRQLVEGTTVLGGSLLTQKVFADEKPDDRYQDDFLKVDYLSTFQRKDQRTALRKRAQGELKKVLGADDRNAVFRCIFNDAGTWDFQSQTGGFDASILLSGEGSRPENKGTDTVESKLKKAKDAIDIVNKKQQQSPISWSDLMVIACKVTMESYWRSLKIARAETEQGGQFIADAFGAEWPIQLGRKDSDKPAPEGRLPSENASVQEVKEYFLKLDNPSYPPPSYPFAPKAPFYERVAFVLYPQTKDNPEEYEKFLTQDDSFKPYKKKYDSSRQTISRTDYEVDFINYFTKLVNLGAKYDPDAYLFPIPIRVPKKGVII